MTVRPSVLAVQTERRAQGGQRGASTGNDGSRRTMLQKCGRELGHVDRAGKNLPDAGSYGVRRGDLVAEPFTAHSSDGAREPSLPGLADLGEQHLPNVTSPLDHALPPAMAGTIDTASPALSSVLSPSRKRMSSSPM